MGQGWQMAFVLFKNMEVGQEQFDDTVASSEKLFLHVEQVPPVQLLVHS
jgi:hypothetical protein